MIRYVQSLLEAKQLVMNTESLDPTSLISLNLKYSNKRTKFRIAGTLQKETPQEVEATHHAVEEDRKMYLQVGLALPLVQLARSPSNCSLPHLLTGLPAHLIRCSLFQLPTCYKIKINKWIFIAVSTY